MTNFERIIMTNNNIDTIKAQLTYAEEQSSAEIETIKQRLFDAETEAAKAIKEMNNKKTHMIETLSYDPAAVYIVGMCKVVNMTSNNDILKIIATFITNYINGDISELEFHTILAMEVSAGVQSMMNNNNEDILKHKDEIYEFIDEIMTIATIDKTEYINATSNIIITDIMETLTHIMAWVD